MRVPHLTRIALDIRFRTISGSSIAIQHLARSLVELAPADVGFVPVRYPDQTLTDPLDALDAIHVPKMPVLAELAWNELKLPGLLKSNGVDLYHGMKQCGPLRLHCPQVHTVDAIKRGAADELPMPLVPRLYWGRYVCGRYKRSDHLMPVSDYVSRFLTDCLGIEPDRLTVVNNGVAQRFLEAGRSRNGKRFDPLTLNAPYVINVGAVIPLKNQIAAVQALARIADRVPHHLVLLGQEDPVYGPKVREAAQRAGLADRVHHVGFVEPDGLIEFLLGADIMAHTSRTEGFSLAISEAMACGLPLIVTRRGGLNEQCGDAALYLENPDDHDTLAELMRGVLTDTTQRETMRQRGLERVAPMSWPAAARKTLGVYNRLLSTA